MKRFAILLAVAALGGSGCVDSHPCDSSVTIRWPTFRLADGTVTADCATAGVPWITVYIDGVPVSDQAGNVWHFACSDGGANIFGLHSGSQVVTVEGVDSTDFIILRQEFTLVASGCGTQVQDVQPAEGFLSLAYHFSPSDVCVSNTSYMWFALFDETVGATTVGIDTGNTDAEKRTYPCGDPILFRMPVGGYTLQRVEEWNRTGLDAFTITGANCTPSHFQISGGATSQVTAVLTDSSTACP